MKCYECGREFAPDDDEQEVCERCEREWYAEHMPEALDGELPDKTPCWERDVEVDGQVVTYRAHAAGDPETVALLDELVQAAYRHMVQTRKVQ